MCEKIKHNTKRENCSSLCSCTVKQGLNVEESNTEMAKDLGYDVFKSVSKEEKYKDTKNRME